MKVSFKDCSFEDFEPSYKIEYKGKKYKAISISIELNDGSKETHIISTTDLYEELFANGADENGVLEVGSEEDDIDNQISYFAENWEKVYRILEDIIGEKVFFDNLDNAEIYVVSAIGVSIPTEIKISKTYKNAKKIMKDMFKRYGMNPTEAEEMSTDCWKGYSPNSDCDVEIQLHYFKSFDK